MNFFLFGKGLKTKKTIGRSDDVRAKISIKGENLLGCFACAASLVGS
jgi:hypothetical protein